MLYDELILQGADPGANLGASFSSGISERQLIPKGAYLHELMIALKADTSTAAVALATFLDILNPFVFKAAQETRIQLRGRDLLALNMFLYGSVPMFFEANAINDDAKIFGLKVPVYEQINKEISYSWAATYVAQTNVSNPLIEVAARWSDKALQPAPIYAVEQPFTTAGSTGRTSLNMIIPRVGDLIGLILWANTMPTNTADAASVQRLQLYLNGNKFSQYNVGTTGFIKGFNQDNQEELAQSTYANYRFIDLREDPIDAKANEIGVEVDVQAASESARLIPVMLKK
jgi:hypothetical protein